MNCPVCDEQLRVIEKYGVEVDICPGCKGVWLDRGELDKIIAMVSADETAVREAGPRAESAGHDERLDTQREYRLRSEHGYRKDDYSTPKQGEKRRRGSWLSDLLEGFGGDD